MWGPRTSKRIVGAFVASLGAITLATEACVRAQVPLRAAVPALILAGLAAFSGTLLVTLATRVRRRRRPAWGCTRAGRRQEAVC